LGFQRNTPIPEVAISAARLTEYENQLDRVAQLLADTQDSYYNMLDEILPKTKDGRSVIGRVESHIPHQLTDKGRLIVAQLAELGDVFTRSEALRLQRQGHPGAVLLDQLINAVSRGGRIEQQIGATRYVDERIIGVSTAMAITDNGIINIEKDSLRRVQPTIAGVLGPEGQVLPNNLKPSYMTVPELNVELATAIRLIADDPRSGIVLPRNWDNKVFNDNPLEVVGNYIDNLHEVIQLWQTVEALKSAGLAFAHSSVIDIGKTNQAIMDRLMENTVRVIESKPISEIDPHGTVYHATRRKGTAQTSRKIAPGEVIHFGSPEAATSIGLATTNEQETAGIKK
jgi:hypothetical protein